jgi:hypothetical protein
MSCPLARDDRAGAEIELQGRVQRLGRTRIWYRLLPAHGGDHTVHLAQRQRRGRQQRGPIRHADGFP